jgi:hypothetical protein
MTRALMGAALSLAAALPVVAAALDWTARAGLGYFQEDRTQPGAPTQSLPRLDLDLSLDVRGFVVQPDALLWSGTVDYRSVSARGAQHSVESALAYRLQASAFTGPSSPVSLSAFALRTEGDGSATGVRFGSTVQSEGGSLMLRLPGAPVLNAGYTRTESRYAGALSPAAHSARDTVTASTAQSGALFGFNVGYQGSFGTGTYAADNFDDHRVNLTGNARIADGTTLNVTNGFYRRDPITDSSYNPEQQQNLLSAVLRVDGTVETGGSQRVQYTHGASMSRTRDTTETRTAQELAYELERPFHERTWFVTGRAAASLDDRARDATRSQTAGQSLGATVSYRVQDPERTLDLHAGPTVAVIEPDRRATELGWGAGAGASFQRVLPGMTWSAQYGVAYATAVGAPGSTFSQQATVTADGHAGLGRLRGTLNANASRTSDDMFGVRASRALTARAEFGTRNSAAWLDAGVSDGLASPLRTTFGGDGLLLGPGYDVHTRGAGVGARAALGALSGSWDLRLASSDYPDRPVQDDLELRGEVALRRGAFVMSLEDRYVVALDHHGQRGAVNVVFFRVSRVFGTSP